MPRTRSRKTGEEICNNRQEMRNFFQSISISPEFIFKLIALVFALGVLYQRVDSQAASLKERFSWVDTANTIRFNDLSQRLTRVETKLDQRP